MTDYLKTANAPLGAGRCVSSSGHEALFSDGDAKPTAVGPARGLTSDIEPGTLSAPNRAWLQPRSWSRGSHVQRFNYLAPFLTDKSVLDLGCASGRHRPDWIHGLVLRVANDVVGVDIDSEGVRHLRAQGHAHIHVADATKVRLRRQFDVVLAGELIEHVDNPGDLLETARAHLSQPGRLVLTTPNAFAISNFIYRFGPRRPRLNSEHTCWYCDQTLTQLLDRHGFSVEYLTFIPHNTPGPVRSTLASLVRRAVPSHVRWNTILAVARPA